MSEILCSRCGTPFPQEKGKPTVTCAVCGQLRPDLDITLDDDDDVSGALGASDAPVKVSAAPPAAPARSHVLTPSPDATLKSPAQSPAPPPSARAERHYVSMSEDHGDRRDRRPTLSELIGPVPLIVVPLAAGVVGALKMLSLVDDFAAGSWYAVGAVLMILVIGSLIAGMLASGVMYLVRARWKILLRMLFVVAAAGVAYIGVREIPTRVQVRANALPGIVLHR